MLTVFDVAKYILDKIGSISAMKLQKLVYYCQAWSLVWDENFLFEEDFEAWSNGPVIPILYDRHRGLFKVDSSIVSDGNVSKITDVQKETIDKVLDFYGNKTAQWLSNLSHNELPWQNARGDLEPMAISTAVISKGAMEEYYSSI